jgi:hypothetical protein
LPGVIAVRQGFTQEALDFAFWAGLASLVICFSAVRVISIGQRWAGRLLLGETKLGETKLRETKLRETKTAFQFVARTGGFAPLRGCNALQMVLAIVQVLTNRFAGMLALAATGFSGLGTPPPFKFRFEAPAERVKQV